MSASQEPDISDIHSPTVVGETLSVSTSSGLGHPIEVVGSVSLNSVEPVSPLAQPLTVNVTIPSDNQPPIPNVGASISVGGDGGGMTDRTSNALLSIASNSLNLTEILNAQQQALEQFQCQLQLAQQTEAINQRLDAIERTLNSLIQQRAQEDAVKTHHHQQQVVEQQQPPQSLEAEDLQAQAQVHLNASLTPCRPSQQIQMLSDSMGGSESKKKKLPRELCSKVRSSYHALNLEFKIDERFLSPTNQRVTDTLIDHVYTDTNGAYPIKDIKRSAHRYYESRRRLGIEELPDRQTKAAEQRKRRKYRARQQRAFDRRKKFVRESEQRYWDHVTPSCMTEESDSENGERILTHQLLWRSEFMNQFVMKLDNRYDKTKKSGAGSTVKRERSHGLPSTSSPPATLPSWMIDPSYKMTPATSITTVCVRESSLDPNQDNSDDLSSYTTLITEVEEIQDDSSDFELPETVVA